MQGLGGKDGVLAMYLLVFIIIIIMNLGVTPINSTRAILGNGYIRRYWSSLIGTAILHVTYRFAAVHKSPPRLHYDTEYASRPLQSQNKHSPDN